MFLIALANTKGGVSKSTLASQLVIWLFDRGYRVGLLDVDPQATSSQWILQAEPAIPVRTAESLDEIGSARQELSSLVDLLVLDTPGNARSDMAQAATIIADIVLIPLQPSKADLREVKNALAYVKLGQSISDGRKPRPTIVITMTAKGDLQTKQLRRDLAAIDLAVATAEVRRLNALRDGFGTSITRLVTPRTREAAEDLEVLFAEVLTVPLEALRAQGLQRGRK